MNWESPWEGFGGTTSMGGGGGKEVDVNLGGDEERGGPDQKPESCLHLKMWLHTRALISAPRTQKIAVQKINR